MKNRLVILLLVLCLLPVLGSAEKSKDYYSLFQAAKEAGDEEAMAQIRMDMPQRLHPFRDAETGLWGYINFLGEWVIEPQFGTADNFRGDYAATEEPYDEDDESCHEGIIDRNGNWVVEPHYFVDGGYDGWYYGGLTLGYYQFLDWDIAKFGLFDVPSGCFSGLVYDHELTLWNGSRLVPVSLNGRDCYVDRSNGEVAFYLPEELRASRMNREDSQFVDGFAKVFPDYGRDLLDRYEDKPEAFIINERGEVLDLSGIVFYSERDWLLSGVITPGGLVLAREKDAELYGYYDLNVMDWRVQPEYTEAYDFSYSGYACVLLSEGNYGHIDTQGELLANGFGERYHYLGEYAYLMEANILINAAGETVIAFPSGCRLCEQWDNEMREGYDYYVSPEGLMEVYDKSIDGYGLMNLYGEWVLPPEEGQAIYSGEETFSEEGWRFFSEGYQAVRRRGEAKTISVTLVNGTTREQTYYDRKIGYVNTKGEVVIDFLYDDAGAFLDGLAWVERDGKRGYVDAFGREIMMEP